MGNYAGYGQDILRTIGFIYIGICIVALALALWLPKDKTSKLAAALLVIVITSILPIQAFWEYRQEKQAAGEFKLRYDKAKALFEEKCKTAGEKIYKTVENVEGIQLLNLRQGNIAENRANPNWPEAGHPSEATGLGYIATFLEWEHNDGKRPRGFLNENSKKATARGYQFVDVKQEDGSFLRYRLKQPENLELLSEPVRGQPARYALGSVNHVDPTERARWVAGVTITVTDTQTGEVVAQRISYAFEPGLGNTDGSRQPWSRAVTCPGFSGWDIAKTRLFVDQILKPVQGK